MALWPGSLLALFGGPVQHAHKDEPTGPQLPLRAKKKISYSKGESRERATTLPVVLEMEMVHPPVNQVRNPKLTQFLEDAEPQLRMAQVGVALHCRTYVTESASARIWDAFLFLGSIARASIWAELREQFLDVVFLLVTMVLQHEETNMGKSMAKEFSLTQNHGEIQPVLHGPISKLCGGAHACGHHNSVA